MALKVACPGCKAVLHVREEYAGKAMQCPRCAAAVAIPMEAAVEAAPQPPEPAVALPPDGPSRSCPECGRQIAASARKCRFCKAWIEDEPDDDDDLPTRRPSPYRPCPKCGAYGAERVLF